MSKEENKYFFSNFSSIREKKEITLEDIVKKTKLQKNYIIAIEKGKFDILPKAYIKLFLKTYAKFLNLDTQKILNSYDEHISGKIIKRRTISSSTPQFIENKISFKDNINPNFKNELYKNSYFIEPKKIISLFIFIVLIIGSWSVVSLIKNNNLDQKIFLDNEPIEWTFYENNDMYILEDTEKIEIKNIGKSNVFGYEYFDEANSLIIGTGIYNASIVLAEKEKDEKKFEGLTEFGIKNGNIKFSINNYQIEFKYKEKAIWGILNPEKDNYLILKYYTYKR